MRLIIRFITSITLCFLFFPLSLNAQNVNDVSYYLEYDSNTCWFDFHIIIEDGWATGAFQRIQLNAQISFVTPTGSTLTVMESYMPLQNNFNYTGTDPLIWAVTSTSTDVLGLGVDFHSITPTLSITSQYNDLATNDTIKLFSLAVDGLNACSTDLRHFENGVDPITEAGSNYANGFTLGGINNIFGGTNPVSYSQNPIVTLPVVDYQNGISIDFTPINSACQNSLTYEWSGPNNYNSTNEDIIINSPSTVDYGMYNLTVSDEKGCADSIEVMVQDPNQINNISITNLRINPTFEHIAIHLDINGDDNQNSTFNIEYRLKGTSTYYPSAMAIRASPEMIVNGSSLLMNFHAGSAMHLLPNSEYELRLTLTDPDGGNQVIETITKTKKFPATQDSENIVYVVPGTAGGDGSFINPYQGLQTAINNIQAGQIIEVGDGSYSPFTLTEGGTLQNPIIIRSANLHGAIIDGSNTTTGVITLGSFIDSIQYVTIDGFDIKNGNWGIDAQNTQYLTIKNNKISDVDFGIYNRRQNGWEHDQYIYNNEIIGRTPWPQTNGQIPAQRGIDIRGNKNVISYNSISNFGDGISTDGLLNKMSYALDIHHNDITRIVDDLIEIDGTVSNTRVYKNRGYNGRMGVSVAPVFGGPAYIFKNVFYNLESSAFKMNNESAGLVIINNSIVKLNNGTNSSVGWQNTVFKNNAILSSHYVIEEYELVPSSNDYWDNNGYKSERAGTATEPWFKWDNIKYNDMSAITGSGITETNSIAIDYIDFTNLSLPTSYHVEAFSVDQDFRLTSNSNLIDAGAPFDNILDLDIVSGNPDIGAYEQGQQTPNYGHDFNLICDRIDLTSRTWNGSISSGWFHPSNWTPCGVPTKETTVIVPASLARYPFLNTDANISNLHLTGDGKLNLSDNITLQLGN